MEDYDIFEDLPGGTISEELDVHTFLQNLSDLVENYFELVLGTKILSKGELLYGFCIKLNGNKKYFRFQYSEKTKNFRCITHDDKLTNFYDIYNFTIHDYRNRNKHTMKRIFEVASRLKDS